MKSVNGYFYTWCYFRLGAKLIIIVLNETIDFLFPSVMETRTHSGSIKHLDVEPMLAKGSKDGEKKNFSLVDRSSAHNDDDTIKFIDQELAKVGRCFKII